MPVWKTELRGDGLVLQITPRELNLADTLDCGQSFRFRRLETGEFEGVAFGQVLRLTQTADEILFHGIGRKEFEQYWSSYFDLPADYEGVKSSYAGDETLRTAAEFAGGIRLLRQERFETLISFLISQNNNIPRIKGCIEKLCRAFGEPVTGEWYAFPTPERLASLSREALAGLSLGYRDSYLIDCARRVADGRLDLDAVDRMELGAAREALRTVQGVGPKVAECVLLFGFHKLAAFPVDTWMRKVLANYYPRGFPEQYRETAGIAQQYLFHYIRKCGEASTPRG